MKKSDFDMIIIGGGATGAGIALDASSRGLQVALFEQNDFDEGTSRYGDQATKIAQISANLDDDGEVPRMTRAELIYTISNEHVKKPLDFLVRRTSIAMTDTLKALKLLPKLANTISMNLDIVMSCMRSLKKRLSIS